MFNMAKNDSTVQSVKFYEFKKILTGLVLSTTNSGTGIR